MLTLPFSDMLEQGSLEEDQRARVVEVAEAVSFEDLAVQAAGEGGAW